MQSSNLWKFKSNLSENIETRNSLSLIESVKSGTHFPSLEAHKYVNVSTEQAGNQVGPGSPRAWHGGRGRVYIKFLIKQLINFKEKINYSLSRSDSWLESEPISSSNIFSAAPSRRLGYPALEADGPPRSKVPGGTPCPPSPSHLVRDPPAALLLSHSPKADLHQKDR